MLKERTLSSAAPRHARSVQAGKEEINIHAQTDGLRGEPLPLHQVFDCLFAFHTILSFGMLLFLVDGLRGLRVLD